VAQCSHPLQGGRNCRHSSKRQSKGAFYSSYWLDGM
jgi:hypothetical protein